MHFLRASSPIYLKHSRPSKTRQFSNFSLFCFSLHYFSCSLPDLHCRKPVEGLVFDPPDPHPVWRCISVLLDRYGFSALFTSLDSVFVPSSYWQASKVPVGKKLWQKNCFLLRRTLRRIWCLHMSVSLLLAVNEYTRLKSNLMEAWIDTKHRWLPKAINITMRSSLATLPEELGLGGSLMGPL